jgi:catechol 2,3-dioxygenase-like lactoylglutathione lyase family enzyme
MKLTAVRAGAYLHHVALQSPDPENLCRFYSRAMDMTLLPSSSGLFKCEGPRRRFIAVTGMARQLAYAGLACRDPEGLQELRARAQEEGLAIEPSPSPYFEAGAFGVRDPDGNLMCFGLAVPGAKAAAPSGSDLNGIPGPTQHLTLRSKNVEAFAEFYHRKLGFALSDRVLRDDGCLTTCFVRSNHEHHTLACFKSDSACVDHHSYEAGAWDYIRDWSDHFAREGIELMWGPGRHGPGNNIFIFVEDPDGNWIEVSAELEIIHDRPNIDWPHEARTLNRWGKAILRS